MADDKFKLPVSSFNELVKIVKAYGHINEPASLHQVSKLAGVNATVVSGNNGFLLATNVLEGGKAKQVTSQGKALAHALDHAENSAMVGSWRILVEECEFLSRLVTAIRIRGGMDQSTLEGHIAYSAGQPKRPQIMTGARTIIDVLRAAELIVEAEGNWVPSDGSRPIEMDKSKTALDITGSANQMIKRNVEQIDKVPAFQVPANAQINGNCVALQINIELKIDCSASDLEGIGTKLRAIIDELSMPSLPGVNITHAEGE